MTTASQLDLLAPPPAQPANAFEAVVAAVMALRAGITLRQLGTADALARELERETPDRERVEWMARRLGLDPVTVLSWRA